MRLKLTNIIFIGFLLIGGCNNDEELSLEDQYTESTPKISNASFEFVLTEELAKRDTLKLSFDIEDVEWDIGLDRKEIDSPYHAIWLHVLIGSSLNKIIPEVYVTEFGYDLIVKSDQPGKIATYRRLHQLDTTLEYSSCGNFFHSRVLVSPNLVDEYDFIEDTVENYYILTDSIYYERNENHFNLLVEFLEEQDDGSYQKFDWVNEFCSTYDGRFPNASTLASATSLRSGTFIIDKISKTKGRLTYNLMNIGFQHLFGGKKLKLRFFIKDRALQNSNLLETEPILIPAL